MLDQESVADPLGEITIGSAPSVTVGAGMLALTFTVALALREPPAPVHCRVNVLLAVSGPTDCDPDRDLLPAQAPEAVHEAALADDHVSVELPFMPTVVGLAVSVTVGAGAIDTVTESEPLPPDPVQVRVNPVCVAKGPTDWLPCVPFAPDQPPLAVHAVALLLVQLNVELPLSGTLSGFALRFTIGGGVEEVTVTVTDWLAEPPVLLRQVRVNDAVAASGPTLWLPDRFLVPLQPPLAVQVSAFVLDHVSVLVPWGATVVGEAESVTVGCTTPVSAVSL